ncbi:MAG: DNA polymerase III subunit delta' [Aquificota bacterium]|nr:MAG: DNA polymerase III subunit delta' [Aquificota bacterium]
MKIIGHEREKKFIRKILDRNYKSFSLLFEGKKCSGKKLVALQTARAFLCEKKYGFGCNECESCKLVNNTIKNIYENKNLTPHPYLKIVKPENQKEIKIDQIREVINFLRLKTDSGKVVIIDDAEKMNIESMNALLKTLEEPPENSMLILITESHTFLLPTIVSRTQKIRFKPLSNQEIYEILLSKGIDKEKAKKIALLSDGSLCNALFIINHENIYKFTKDIFNLIVKIDEIHPEGIITFIENVEKLDIENIYNILDLLNVFMHKTMLKGEISVQFYENYINEVNKLKKAIEKGVKKKLAFEAFYFNLKGEQSWIT